MVKGICKDCVFSEDLSEGMPEGESLWICWAKRKEYHEAPQVCSQFQVKEEGADAAAEIANIADAALGMTPADHSSQMKKIPAADGESKPEPAPENDKPTDEAITDDTAEKTESDKTTDSESKSDKHLSEDALFGEPPIMAKEESGEQKDDDDLLLGKASKSFSDDMSDPKSGNLISKTDVPKPRGSNIKLLLVLLIIVLAAGGVSYILFTPEGAQFDVIGLRAMIGLEMPKQLTAQPAPVKTKKPEQQKAPEKAVEQPAGKPEEAKTGETAEAQKEQQPSEQEAAQQDKTPEEEIKEEPKKEEAAKEEPAKEEAKEEKVAQADTTEHKFVGPKHKMPSYVFVHTITKKQEWAIDLYNKLKKRGFDCGYLWIPDYPSLSGQKRWMVFVGPFDTEKEATWRFEIFKKRVRPRSFMVKLDMKPDTKK